MLPEVEYADCKEREVSCKGFLAVTGALMCEVRTLYPKKHLRRQLRSASTQLSQGRVGDRSSHIPRAGWGTDSCHGCHVRS